MIQDRLTAKFRTAKKFVQATPKAKPVAKVKPVKDPLDEAIERGRTAAGSLFWL